jgi:hypothetical protein
MFRKYVAGLMVVPVLFAAWLTFSASPIVGLPLHQVAMFELPDASPEVAELDPAAATEVE